MELFEYWWLESQQDDNPATKKEIAKEAWGAAKSLYSQPENEQQDRADS